jgi:N-acyl-L-homoserine lactone synthetase
MHYKSTTDTIQKGERVAYSRAFLCSIGEHGALAQARGVVTGLTEIGETILARIDWQNDYMKEIPERVNVKNLVLVNAMQWEER